MNIRDITRHFLIKEAFDDFDDDDPMDTSVVNGHYNKDYYTLAENVNNLNLGELDKVSECDMYNPTTSNSVFASERDTYSAFDLSGGLSIMIAKDRKGCLEIIYKVLSLLQSKKVENDSYENCNLFCEILDKFKDHIHIEDIADSFLLDDWATYFAETDNPTDFGFSTTDDDEVLIENGTGDEFPYEDFIDMRIDDYKSNWIYHFDDDSDGIMNMVNMDNLLSEMTEAEHLTDEDLLINLHPDFYSIKLPSGCVAYVFNRSTLQ